MSHSHNKIFIYIMALLSLCSACQSTEDKKTKSFQAKQVFKTDKLSINQIAPNAYQHISYKHTDEWGDVPCNGLVVCNNKESFVFDTPTDDSSALLLINWIQDSLHCNIKGVLPTHFHDDCLGGLNAFHNKGITSYGYYKTADLAKENKFAVPQITFQDSLVLKIGNEYISAKHFGEGHTKDNVVGYFPSEQVLFGGCLIKELDASKGYLGDANEAAWSNTVRLVKQSFPKVQVVVPGHGECGDKALLDYTIDLFKDGK
jgi:metallo-beta-lactamase class B